MRLSSILLASLMILVSFSPVVLAEFDKEISTEKEDIDSAFGDFPIKAIDETGPRIVNGASGRAPCSAVQTDGGTAGDLSLIHI